MTFVKIITFFIGLLQKQWQYLYDFCNYRSSWEILVRRRFCYAVTSMLWGSAVGVSADDVSGSLVELAVMPSSSFVSSELPSSSSSLKDSSE